MPAIPLYDDAGYLPCKVSDAVREKRFVVVSGNRSADGNITVAEAGAAAGAKILGVAQFNAAPGDAEDGHVTVAAGPGLIVPVTTGTSPLAANASVTSDSQGRAVAVAGEGVQHAIGHVIDAAAAGADAFVRLFPHAVTLA